MPIFQEYAFKYNVLTFLNDLSKFYLHCTFSFEAIKNLDVFHYGLARLTLIKVMSAYLKLASQSEIFDIEPEIENKLYDFILSEIEFFYTIPNPGWPPLHSGTVNDRVEWGLTAWNTSTYDDSKRRVDYSINDDLWRLFEAVGNIKQYINFKKITSPTTIESLLTLAYRCIHEGGQFLDEGYFFQLGITRDSRDHLYAGHLSLKKDMLAFMVDSIGRDTSHFSLFPSMINALQFAYPINSETFNFFARVNSEISRLFFNTIVEYRNGGVFTKNYMDGSNGLYRYDGNDAYLSYELSGTILFGSWFYLNSKEGIYFFENLFNSFPLSIDVISIYQSKFFRNKLDYDDNQIEFLYADPRIKLYSFFSLRLCELL